MNALTQQASADIINKILPSQDKDDMLIEEEKDTRVVRDYSNDICSQQQEMQDIDFSSALQQKYQPNTLKFNKKTGDGNQDYIKQNKIVIDLSSNNMSQELQESHLNLNQMNSDIFSSNQQSVVEYKNQSFLNSGENTSVNQYKLDYQMIENFDQSILDEFQNEQQKVLESIRNLRVIFNLNQEKQIINVINCQQFILKDQITANNTLANNPNINDFLYKMSLCQPAIIFENYVEINDASEQQKNQQVLPFLDIIALAENITVLKNQQIFLKESSQLDHLIALTFSKIQSLLLSSILILVISLTEISYQSHIINNISNKYKSLIDNTYSYIAYLGIKDLNRSDSIVIQRYLQYNLLLSCISNFLCSLFSFANIYYANKRYQVLKNNIAIRRQHQNNVNSFIQAETFLHSKDSLPSKPLVFKPRYLLLIPMVFVMLVFLMLPQIYINFIKVQLPTQFREIQPASLKAANITEPFEQSYNNNILSNFNSINKSSLNIEYLINTIAIEQEQFYKLREVYAFGYIAICIVSISFMIWHYCQIKTFNQNAHRLDKFINQLTTQMPERRLNNQEGFQQEGGDNHDLSRQSQNSLQIMQEGEQLSSRPLNESQEKNASFDCHQQSQDQSLTK